MQTFRTFLILLIVLLTSDAFAATSGSLFMDGNGNYGIGSTAPLAKLQVGVNPSIVAGSSPTVAVKGSLVVDGKIYGDGSGLTNLTSSQWTTSGTGIYYNTGNVAIGTTDVSVGALAVRRDLNNSDPLAIFANLHSAGGGSVANRFVNNASSWGEIGIGGSAQNVAYASRTFIESYTGNGLSLMAGTGGQDIRFYIGGVTDAYEWMRLTAAGNLGIGTATPRAKLEVGTAASVVSGSSPAAIVKGNLVVDGKIYGDGSGLTGLTFSQWTTSGSNIYYNTGNVGIGSVSPASALAVTGVLSASSGRESGMYLSPIINQSGTAGYSALHINAIQNTTGSGYTDLIQGAVNGVNVFEIESTGQFTSASGIKNNTSYTYANFSTATTGPAISRTMADAVPALTVTNAHASSTGDILQLKNNTSTVMVVQRGGNVGIGTTAPVARLDLLGAGTTSATSSLIVRDSSQTPKMTLRDNGGLEIFSSETPNSITHSAAATLTLSDNMFNNSEVHGIRWATGGTNVAGIFMARNASNEHELWFATENATLSTKMVISSVGNIGIGTMDPVAKMHIGGAAVPNAMSITGSDLYVKGNIEFDGRIYGDGSGLTGVSSISGLTDNYIPRANGTSAIENSIMYDDGTNIGIGSASPRNILDVRVASGSNAITITSGTMTSGVGIWQGGGGGEMGTYTNHPLYFLINNANRAILNTNGNFGINTTAPRQKLEVVGSIEIGTTNSATTGVIYKNGTRFMHDFRHPTGGGAVPVGYNVFLGEGVGNFTAGSTATSIYHASYNIAIGAAALSNLTLGSRNVAIGHQGMTNFSDGQENVAVGYFALRGLSSASNNTAVGSNAGFSLTTGGFNTMIGTDAGYGGGNENSVIDEYMTFLGAGASRDVSIPTTTPLSKSVAIGSGATVGASNAVVLGGMGADAVNVGIGTHTPLAGLHLGSGAVPNAMSVADRDDLFVRGNIEFDGRIYGDGSALTGVSSISGLTDNYVTRANGTSAIENSIIYDTGTRIGVGTTSPSQTLEVAGSIATTGTGDSYFTAGNVGIGTTSPWSNFVVQSAGTASISIGAQVGDPNYAVIYLNGSQSADGFNLGGSIYNGDFRINRPTGGSILFTENDLTIDMTIYSGGNVGIGTTVPVQKLEVKGGSILGTEAAITTAASMTVNWVNGNQQYIALNQAGHTINFSNYQVGQVLRLILCQDGTGSRTVTTWDTSIVWASGTAPTLTSGASKCDIISFVCTNAKGTVKNFGTMVANF